MAPITTTVHRIASQLPLGVEEGLPQPSVANCDNLHSVEKTLIDQRRVGRISPPKVRELDAALRFALQIR